MSPSAPRDVPLLCPWWLTAATSTFCRGSALLRHHYHGAGRQRVTCMAGCGGRQLDAASWSPLSWSSPLLRRCWLVAAVPAPCCGSTLLCPFWTSPHTWAATSLRGHPVAAYWMWLPLPPWRVAAGQLDGVLPPGALALAQTSLSPHITPHRGRQ